jgi:hypothetical protein
MLRMDAAARSAVTTACPVANVVMKTQP